MSIENIEYLKSKDIKGFREELLEEQGNICPLTNIKIPIDRAALDHDHNSGHIRQVLYDVANSFEGMILHKFKRSGVHKLIDIETFLLNLIDYWKADYSMNPLHPTERPKPKYLKKNSYNKLKKIFMEDRIGRKAPLFPVYPKTKKINKKLKMWFSRYNIEPEFYGDKSERT